MSEGYNVQFGRRAVNTNRNIKCKECGKWDRKPAAKTVNGLCYKCERLASEKEAEEILARRNLATKE